MGINVENLGWKFEQTPQFNCPLTQSNQWEDDEEDDEEQKAEQNWQKKTLGQKTKQNK